MAKEAQIEKRRSGRYEQELLIQISWVEAGAIEFNVETRTLLVSRYGAKIFLKYELLPNQEIAVYCPITGRKGAARVVARLERGPEGYCYGIEILDQEIDLWNITSPRMARIG